MANLVIKSNTASRTFDIEQKVFKLPFDKDSVKLTITPREPYSIDSENFNYGVLPGQASQIAFSNLGNKVIATVQLSGKINSNNNVILDLPIFGRSTRKIDSFNIIETVSASDNIMLSGSSSVQKSTQNDAIRYSIVNNLGNKKLVLSKTFTIPNGLKFSKAPTYTISENSDRYNVITSERKDKKGVVTSKTFDFYYTSPSVITASQDTQINFFATAKDYGQGTTKQNSIAAEQNTIYSIDKGRNIGPEGGIKRVVVRGTPGSTFSFIVSNSNGLMYSDETGAFTSSGRKITGTVPEAAFGKAYGEAVTMIRIPKSTAGDTISTQFFNEEPVEVQKAKLATTTDITQIEKILGEGKTKSNKVVSLALPSLTFNVTMDTDVLTSTGVYAAEAESASDGAVTLTVDNGSGGSSAATDVLFLNKKIYKSDGTLFGTCTSVTNATTLVFGGGLSSAIAENDILYAYPTAYLGPKVKIKDLAGATVTSQVVLLGAEGRVPLTATERGIHTFAFAVSAQTANRLVQITRQPLFTMPTNLTDNYVVWDSASATEANKAAAVNSSGTSIVSDWDWSAVNKGAKISIKAIAGGNGKILKTTSVGGVDKYAYSEVIIKGEVRVGGVGESSASVSFNLNNFLSIIDPS